MFLVLFLIVLVICWPLVRLLLSFVRFALVGFALMALYGWLCFPPG